MLLAVVLLLGGCTERATPARAPATVTGVPTATGTSAAATATPAPGFRSQSVLDAAISVDEPGCSAAVGVEGSVVWTGVRGVADIASATKISTETLFDIGSVTKQFTATAILLLAEAGKLALDDPVSRHMPELPPWAGTVNLGQLMHQTSGIPDYLKLLEAHFKANERTTQEQAVQALTAVTTLEFPPGSRFEYSNSNYLLLGEIVRRASGENLPLYSTAHIFQPLSLGMVMDPVGQIPNKAISYDKEDGKYRVADSPWEQVGDGGIQTSPSQLVRWADNYRSGKVGGSKLLDAQLAGAVPTDPNGHDRYGAGIYLMGNGALDHDGAWAGFVTSFHVSADRRTSVVVSCNTDKQDATALSDALGQFWM